jgi:O-methyltransferase
MKQLLKKALRGLGYEVRRTSGSVEFDAVATVKEREYYEQWFPPYPLFSPWIGHPEFQPFYEAIKEHTVVSADRVYVLLNFARHSRNLDGDFVECGVFRGGTALLLAGVLKDTGKKLHLFDSFKGLPKGNPQHDNYWQEGSFCNESLESVQKLLKEYQSFITFHPGWIPDTFAALPEKRYAFVSVDVDLYQPALDCCAYFYPRLTPGGVMVFDDYGFPACRGEKDAVDEYFSEKQDSPIVLPTGQALIVKT